MLYQGWHLPISSDLITSRHTLTDGNVIHLCVRFTNAILTRHTWHGHISIISKRRLPRSIKEQIIIDKILLCPARYFLTWKHAKCFSLYSFLRFFCEKQKGPYFPFYYWPSYLMNWSLFQFHVGKNEPHFGIAVDDGISFSVGTRRTVQDQLTFVIIEHVPPPHGRTHEHFVHGEALKSQPGGFEETKSESVPY